LRELNGGGSGFRIWSFDGVMTSAGALPAALSTPPPAGFSDIQSGGKEWRRFVLRHAALPITIEVVEPADVRDGVMWRMAGSLLGPLLLLIIAVSVIASWRIAAAMRPMDLISHEIDARDTDDLGPLGSYRLPREIAPLVGAVNDLMARLGRAIEHEREFADNAAHELRTPLAVLKTRAQIAERALADQPQLAGELSALVAAIDRATGVIEQLLMLARVQGSLATFVPVDLSRLTEDVARILAPAAIDKYQQFDLDIAPGIVVSGNADSLSIVIRNLIENAIRHAPAKSSINVELMREADGSIVLRVADNGPGIPEDKMARATERFTRFSADAQGSGLGLSIVARILKLHGGKLSLQNGVPCGLTSEVRFFPDGADENVQKSE
jgi:signal transduction histidine kinase